MLPGDRKRDMYKMSIENLSVHYLVQIDLNIGYIVQEVF